MCYGTLHRGRTSVLPLLFIASVESIELFVKQWMCELSNKSQQTSICLERTSQILVLVFLPPNAPLMHAPRVNTIVFVGRMLRPLQISSPRAWCLRYSIPNSCRFSLHQTHQRTAKTRWLSPCPCGHSLQTVQWTCRNRSYRNSARVLL